MDFNDRLIESIKDYPPLYKLNYNNLEERAKCWIELATKLQTDEEHIIRRWHTLLQGFRRSANFKYHDKMLFLRIEEEQVEPDTTTSLAPEYTINENNVDNQNNITHCVYYGLPETESNVSSHDGRMQNNGIENMNILENPESSGNDNAIQNSEISVSDGNEYLNIVSSPQCSTEVIPCSSHIQTHAVQNIGYNTDRCEDVIFGELVTATLKRMNDDQKKRCIKKQIMNALLI